MGLLAQLNLPQPAGGAGSAPPVAAPPPVAGVSEPAGHARRTAAKPRRARKPPPETTNNYIALINGINNLVQSWQRPGSLDVAPSDKGDLLARHRALLQAFLDALLKRDKAPEAALALWERVWPRLRAEVERGLKAGLEPGDVSNSHAQLKYAHTTAFVPAAYRAALAEAKASAGLEAPDMGLLAARLVQAEDELQQARKLYEEALKLASVTGKAAGTELPSHVKAVVGLVMLPGTIEEKLAKARAAGIATTAAELVNKVVGATGSFVGATAKIGTQVVDMLKASLVAKGAAQGAIDKLAKVAGAFDKLSKAAKSLGTAASYAAVIADGIKLVAAVGDGDVEEAVAAGAQLAVDAAPLLLGAEVAGPLGVVVVIFKAEMEAFRLAADFIRWCKDETVRKAAEAFVSDCDKIGKAGAYDLFASASILLDPSREAIHAVTMQEAARHAKLAAKNIAALQSHLHAGSGRIGANPKVVASLGTEALGAIGSGASYSDNILMVATQVQQIFKGANAMAKYVRDNFKN